MLIHALFWSGFGAVANIVVQLGLLAILSRLLDAADFGLLASAALTMRFVSYFVQFGLGPALIQRKSLEAAHSAAALIAASCIGLLCWLVFLALAPLAAAYFREPKLVPVLHVVPAIMALGALAAVPQALLRRAMRFRLLAGIDLAAQVFGYGLVGVAMAWSGAGVWSLVGALLAQQLLLLLLGLLAARPTLRWPTRQHYVDLGRYGGGYSVVGFLEFLSCSVETLFIGRYLGTSRLGEFNRAQAVTLVPVDQFMGAINRVMFPALASLQADPKAMAQALLLSLKLSSLITFPLAVGISMASPGLVALALGPDWTSAAPVAALLAWSIPAAYLSTFIGMTYDGLARFKRKTVLILAITGLKVGLMALLSGQGLVAVVQVMLLAEWVRVLLGLLMLRGLLPLRWRDLASVLWRGLLAGAVVALALTALGQLATDLVPAALLGAQLALAAAVALPCIRHLLRAVVSESEATGADLSQLRRLVRI